MQQFARCTSKSPARRRQLTGYKLVGGERRNDEYKAEVGDSEVQQQNVGDSAHAHARHYDDDDERVSDETEQSDGGKKDRHDNSVQREPVAGRDVIT